MKEQRNICGNSLSKKQHYQVKTWMGDKNTAKGDYIRENE